MEITGFRCNTYSRSNPRAHNTDFGEVKEYLMEIFHVRLTKVATMCVWKWSPTCCWCNSTNLNFLVAFSDVVFGRWRRSSLKQRQRDTNPESRSEWSSVSKPALSSRRTKTEFFHLGYLKQAIHHPERNCLTAMKCTKGRLNFFPTGCYTSKEYTISLAV